MHHGLRAQQLDHAAVGVRNLKVTQDWLAAVLGMVPFRSDDPNFAGEALAMVRNGAVKIALLQLPEGETPLQGSRSQKGHVALRVPTQEFERFRYGLPALLQEHRVHPQQSVQVEEDNYGVQRSLFFHDPDGNELEVTTWDEDAEDQPNEGADFLRRALLLDVRTPQEFQEVALPKSLLVPHHTIVEPEGEGVDRVLQAVEWNRDAPIAAYCAVGVRSGAAKAALDACGFTNVQNWVNIETIVRGVGKPS